MSLRLMSTAVRQTSAVDDKAELVLKRYMESVEMAKEAVAINDADPESWG